MDCSYLKDKVIEHPHRSKALYQTWRLCHVIHPVCHHPPNRIGRFLFCLHGAKLFLSDAVFNELLADTKQSEQFILDKGVDMIRQLVKIFCLFTVIIYTIPVNSDSPKGKLLVVGDSIDWGFHGGSEQPKIKRGTQVNWAQTIAKTKNLDLKMVSIPGATARDITKHQVPYAVDLLNTRANDISWVVTYSGGGREVLEFIRSKDVANTCMDESKRISKTCLDRMTSVLDSIQVSQDKALSALRQAAGKETPLLVRTYPVLNSAKRCAGVPIDGAQAISSIMFEGSKHHNPSKSKVTLPAKQTVVGLNERLRKLAKKHNARLVDVASAFEKTQSKMDTMVGQDCVNLTRKGYKAIERVFTKVSR